MRYPRNKKRTHFNREEDRMIDGLQDKADYEQFKEEVLPALRKMVKQKAPPKDMLDFIKSLATAKVITKMVTEQDTMKVLALYKEILDRTEGKSVEKSETTHKFQNLKKEQLDAVLKSKLKSLNNTDEDTETH